MIIPQNYQHPCLCPCIEPQSPPTSTGDSPIPPGRSGLGSYEVTALSPGSWCTQDLVCSLQEWSFCFPKSCGVPAIKPHWSLKPDTLGAPPPDATPPGCRAWCGAQNFHCCGVTSTILLFSSLCIAHLVGMGLDFITIVPLLPSHCGFFCVFGCRIIFLVGSIVFLLWFAVLCSQQLVVILVLLWEEVSWRPSLAPLFLIRVCA